MHNTFVHNTEPNVQQTQQVYLFFAYQKTYNISSTPLQYQRLAASQSTAPEASSLPGGAATTCKADHGCSQHLKQSTCNCQQANTNKHRTSGPQLASCMTHIARHMLYLQHIGCQRHQSGAASLGEPSGIICYEVTTCVQACQNTTMFGTLSQLHSWHNERASNTMIELSSCISDDAEVCIKSCYVRN